MTTLQKNKIKFGFNRTNVLHGGIKSIMGAWRGRKENEQKKNPLLQKKVKS